MKKLITLIYFQVYVDILGFPVYLKQTLTNFGVKKNNNIDNYFFNKKNKSLFESNLIKQN